MTNQYLESIYNSISCEVMKQNSEIKKEVIISGLVFKIEKLLNNEKIEMNEKLIDDLISNEIINYLTAENISCLALDYKKILRNDEFLKKLSICYDVKDV